MQEESLLGKTGGSQTPERLHNAGPASQTLAQCCAIGEEPSIKLLTVTVRESTERDVNRSQILTSKVDPCTVRVNIYL